MPHDDQLKAQAALFEQALDTPVTDQALDFLSRAALLLRIADDDVDTIKPVIHSAAGRDAARLEFDQLSDDHLAELRERVCHHWSLNLNLAVRVLWHTANVLGFQATSLDPKHVALVAASYLSRDIEDVYDELAAATK